MIRKRLISLLFSLTLCFALLLSFAFASSPQFDLSNELTVSSYLSSGGMSPSSINESELYLCELDLSIENKNGNVMLSNASEPTLYGILSRTHNEDGTWSDNVIFSLVDSNNDGQLESSITPASFSANTLTYDANSNLYTIRDSDASIMETQTYLGYTFYTTATYTSINMYDYNQGGYAFAPSYSNYRITYSSSSGSSALTNAQFITVLSGMKSVSSSDPSANVDNDWPVYERTSSVYASPQLGNLYSFNDATYYSAQGYSGQLIHVTSGFGNYFIKTEFIYGSTQYRVGYSVYPYQQFADVVG